MHEIRPQVQTCLLATDVDGTLTDGGMYYASSGEISKRFHARDGIGGKLLQAMGIKVGFVSSDTSPVIEARARRLSVDFCFAGVTDKVTIIHSLCAEHGIVPEQVAFLGDDVQDLAAMRCVGLPAAVGDAHPSVKDVADYVCEKDGGYGAFREFAEHLLSVRNVSVQEAFRALSTTKCQG